MDEQQIDHPSGALTEQKGGDTLLPCPFCGGPASEVVGLVGCQPCAIGRRDAESWNRRGVAVADEQALAEAASPYHFIRNGTQFVVPAKFARSLLVELAKAKAWSEMTQRRCDKAENENVELTRIHALTGERIAELEESSTRFLKEYNAMVESLTGANERARIDREYAEAATKALLAAADCTARTEAELAKAKELFGSRMNEMSQQVDNANRNARALGAVLQGALNNIEKMHACEADPRDVEVCVERIRQALAGTLQIPPAVSRAEWHDKAWALFHAKTFEDTMLHKVNVHTMRAVFDATYDAIAKARA